VREKYEATKVLEVGDKVIELKRIRGWLLSLSSRSSEMHEQLEQDIAIEHEIQVAKESQTELEQWDTSEIRQGRTTDPFVGYKRQVLPLFFATQVEVFLHSHPLNYRQPN
jgi:hypothetical protein